MAYSPEGGERVVICCRCDRAIRPGEKYEKTVHDRATGVPLVVYSHRAHADCTAPGLRPKRHG
ncbi:hypothetical protein [Streptomyces apocyni]|uniref:hypothetical protein n=1 Tax=Streptomyces apocyni TaxID=2654677 RepID=UPI0012EA7DD5|nr:hypothetical protein [Streptomyces apocyni]